MKLVIGNKNYSSWSLRPWLLMKVLGIPFEEVRIALYTPDSRPQLLALSGAGKVPVLIDDTLTVWDSLAITEYLAEQFPTLSIWPRDPQCRARARCIAAEMHSGFTALRSNMPMNIRGSHPGKGMTPAVAADIERITAIWSDCRAHYAADGPHLFGTFSAVDAFFAPVVSRFTTYGVALPAVCAAYVETIQALPAMCEWSQAGIAEPERIAASEPYA